MEPKFPELKTNRFRLRRFGADDQEYVFSGLSHPEVITYYGVRYHTLEETAAQMKYFEEVENKGSGFWWAICSPDNSIFYGAVGLYNITHEHRKGEVGYWLLPSYWGKGIMNEVLQIVCNYGFRNENLHRIEALVETGNAASGKVLEKLGFILEGTMQDCELKNGRFISLRIYAKLATGHLYNISNVNY
jgi:ribosomal-protein-alanine N-acetyltransferase